jgi:hypothetical protein
MKKKRCDQRTITFTLTRSPAPIFEKDSIMLLLQSWLPTGWRAGDVWRSAGKKVTKY